MSEYAIQDKVETVTTTYSKMVIDVTEVKLGVSANIRVILYSEDLGKAEGKYLKLVQPEYSFWGSDDSFITTWVCSQLGLVLK